MASLTSSCPIRSTAPGCARRIPRPRSRSTASCPGGAPPISCRSPAGSASMRSSSRCAVRPACAARRRISTCWRCASRSAVAVTVRCIEYLSRRKTAVAPSYDRLLAATPGLEPWRQQLDRLRAEPQALSPRRPGRADQVRRGAGANLSRTPRPRCSICSGSRSTPISSRSSAATARNSPSWQEAVEDARVTFAAVTLRRDVAGLDRTRRAGLACRPRRSPARALLRLDRRRGAAVSSRAATGGPHRQAAAPNQPEAFDRLERRAAGRARSADARRLAGPAAPRRRPRAGAGRAPRRHRSRRR